MQNNNRIPQDRRSLSPLPCTVYDPRQRRPPTQYKTDRKLCTLVILLLLLFALTVLIVSCVKGTNGGKQGELPVFLNVNPGYESSHNGGDAPITICIDPGHGFDDPGALCDHTDRYEKDINLEIAMLLADRLEKLGYDIVITRDSDIPPAFLAPNDDGLYLMNPNKRTAFVRSSGADVFISIHCNALENDPDVSGTRLYYYGPSNPLTLKYANVLCNALCSAFPERDIETVGTSFEDSLAVNRDVDIPSVLVEVGYMTSHSDCVLLCDKDWCRSFAYALAKGIDEFVTNIK